MADELEQEEGEFIELPEEEEEPKKGTSPAQKTASGGTKDDGTSKGDDDDDGAGKSTDADGDADDEDEDDEESSDKMAVESSDKQERRRREKKAARLRRKAAIERTQRELADLRDLTNRQAQQIAQLAARGQSQDAYNLQQQMRDTALKFKRAEAALAQAVAKGDGEAARQAISDRDEFANHLRQLDMLGRQMKNGARPPSGEQPAAKAEPPHPAMAKQYNSWRSRNGWFDPKLEDRDSKIAYVIDEDLESEGFDPKTPEYWDELDRRISEFLPHRATEGLKKTLDRGKTNGKKGPPVAGPTQNGRQAPGTKQSGIFVSKARKQAMIDAGIWDDPERRNKQLRAYQKFDKEHPELVRR